MSVRPLSVRPFWSRGTAARIAVLLGLTLGLTACGINDVPTKGEAARKEFADLQAQYQRRADLIPNLVETVRGFAEQEQAVLTGVVEARARATQVNITPGDLGDPQKLAQFEAAQGALSSALARLMVVVERYPDLKSNQNFLALQDQLEGTENRIAIARENYNETVRIYNLEFLNIPDKWVAGIFHGGEAQMPMFTAAPGAEAAPTVDFGADRP